MKHIGKNTTKILWILVFVLLSGIKVVASENVSMPDVNQTVEAECSILSSSENYRDGWYKSWGGAYENVKGSVCTKFFVNVPKDTYYIYINDSRVKLAISEYDQNGTWLKCKGGFRDGDEFVKQEKTKYITLTISSDTWGINFYELFQNGLKIEFAKEEGSSAVQTQILDMQSIDFLNADNWMAGAYSKQTGAFSISTTKICLKYQCMVEDREYVVSLPSAYLKLNLIELDAENKVIASYDLYGGQRWKKNAQTTHIAITVTGNNKNLSVNEYKAFIQAGKKFGIYPYTTYQPNHVMAEFSAGAFIQTMNVGWNLGNSLDSKATLASRGNDTNINQEMYWGNPYISKELIDYVASCGFNTIRIPVTWYYNTYEGPNGELHIGQKWIARVKEVVDYAIANDMYVILNTHHEQPILYAGVSDSEMAKVYNNAYYLWSEIAEYFKDYDEHLIFEAYNEIDNLELSWNYSDLSANQMNQMNQLFVETVRATGGNNAKRILMVPTLLDGTKSNILDAFILPNDTAQDRLIVQVHTYAKRFHQSLEYNMTEIEKFANKWGVPVVIGEFGTTNTYENEELRSVHAANFIARAAKHGIKCIWWDNGTNYAIIDRWNYANSNTQIIQGLLQGVQGVAYEVQGELLLNQSNQYVLKMPNLKTGAIEDKYWGTLTTDLNGAAIQIPEGKSCIICLKAINDATDIWLQRVVFYDAAGNFISGKEIQNTDHIADIPSGAVSMRVSMNSPTRTISYEQYGTYMRQEDLELSVCFYDINNVVPVQTR